MGHTTLKIKDRYYDWSTVVDAPVTEGMSREAIIEHFLRRYGEHQRVDILRSVQRADEKGIGFPDWTLEDIESYNRAGPKETTISLDEIYERYQ